jgi:hypothetical protein
MLIGLVERGLRPALITFADVGAEKAGTYEFVPIFSDWLERHGFPRPVVCQYQPKAQTAARYRQAVLDAQRDLGLQLSAERIDQLSRLYGNVLANSTLPSQAFGMKSCSLKWKVEAQEKIRPIHPELLAAWGRGEKVRKLIGFDVTETHRTFADHKAGSNIGAAPGVPHYNDRYEVHYPLQEWGWDRERCGQVILDAGLPLPPKSACFCCPAMKAAEIASLAIEDPAAYALAIHLERTYRHGPHFRGDSTWTVVARHRQTGERVAEVVTATTKDEAKTCFRMVYRDVERRQLRLFDGGASRHQWQITSVSPAVRGLGRTTTWETIEV